MTLALIGAVILVLVVILITLMSFVSYDEVTNRLIAATLNISLQEDNFDHLTEEEKAALVPNKRLPKDPKVQNTDKTDAFVFLKVTMPVYYATRVEEDGTKTESRHRQDAFWLKTEDHAADPFTTFHTKEDSADREYWVELPECETGTDYQSDTRTYVFGYSVCLRFGETTETLFDYIELKNLIQYEIDPDARLNVEVKAYGIQADHLGIDIEKGTDTIKTVQSEEQLTKVYRMIGQNLNTSTDQEQGV